ncbi:hypothetical protein OAE61_05255 [Verrucomicrobiales bacterium]|jgi:hypothetical protein|nr:hypothetical protein [Verrucomicrobiales bacterium]MDC0276533.1 hypothetical protein [Verrucomicrobiales bacterium]MDC0321728.1 hypothetical protein [Verrucomicrobiales bacterium]
MSSAEKWIKPSAIVATIVLGLGVGVYAWDSSYYWNPFPLKMATPSFDHSQNDLQAPNFLVKTQVQWNNLVRYLSKQESNRISKARLAKLSFPNSYWILLEASRDGMGETGLHFRDERLLQIQATGSSKASLTLQSFTSYSHAKPETLIFANVRKSSQYQIFTHSHLSNDEIAIEGNENDMVLQQVSASEFLKLFPTPN